jgi:hypothetical protein
VDVLKGLLECLTLAIHTFGVVDDALPSLLTTRVSLCGTGQVWAPIWHDEFSTLSFHVPINGSTLWPNAWQARISSEKDA